MPSNSKSAIVDTSLLDGSRAGLIVAQPGWMLAGSAALSGTVFNAMWLAIVLSTTAPSNRKPALDALTVGGPVLIALCLWFALRAFARGPSVLTRAAVLATYALAVSFFIFCATVQIVVLEPRRATPASRSLSFDAVTIVVALLPALVLLFAATKLLREDLTHLARFGYRASDSDRRN